MDPPAVAVATRQPTSFGHGSADEGDELLARFTRAHPRLTVLTGAGCSTASGLGDYRDRAGQWKRKQPITGQVFIGDESMRKRYWVRSAVGWPVFGAATPAPAHAALAQLQRAGIAQALITQNVDGLHQKAGHSDVIDLHGVLATVVCLGCGERSSRDRFQTRLLDANPWVAGLSAAHAPDGDADLETPEVERLDVPACGRCNGMLKPDVVFFGENVPRERVQRALAAVEASDALLVAGSSLMVFSGYRFCRAAAARGQPIVLINEGITRADDLATLKVGGDVGARLVRLAAASAQLDAGTGSVEAQANG